MEHVDLPLSEYTYMEVRGHVLKRHISLASQSPYISPK